MEKAKYELGVDVSPRTNAQCKYKNQTSLVQRT
ncbi:hypothetical protein PDE_08925 [Penicillium oxalicum 114-2]|uniref:Uncharacterized protein n=1 Tax=Penicillium oxalicum (strain 114-2 / CGMCC 5302) TaxID=933388 RepID=S8B540_PENO1|nr:hypothetical protein PDE_08925 [Penicillium oxalicum 114-2]